MKHFARVVQSIGAMLAGTVVAFALLRSVPPGPLAPNGDQPVVVHYFAWLSRVVRGDFGWSTVGDEPVLQVLRAWLPATLELWFVALVATIALGAVLGIVRTRLRAPFPTGVLAALLLLARSAPVFLLGQLLAVTVGFTPLSSTAIVPVVCVVMPFAAWSAALLYESLGSQGATARIGRRGVLRPLAMTISLIAPALLAATLITEGMAVWPGIGRPFFSSLGLHDAGAGAGILVVYWVAIVSIKLVGDLWLGTIDRAPQRRSDSSPKFAFARGAALALGVCAVLAIAGLVANLAGNPYYIDVVHWQGYPLPPSAGGHVLGTDENGRDLLARLLFALRTSLGIAAFAALVATAIGALVAAATARLPWFEDRAALAVTAIRSFSAFPLVMVAAATVIRSSTKIAVIPAILTALIAFVTWPAIVTAIRTARPGSVPRTVFSAAIGVTAGALLLEVTLSAIGIGVQPPMSSLGNMLMNAQSNVFVAPWVVAVPTLAIMTALFALNAAADGLRNGARA